MPFLSVAFNNFRNINDTSIDLSAKEVYFVGENGQGKSNLLESLYISSYGASFRTHNESEIIKNGGDSYSVRSLFKEESGKTSTVSVIYKDGQKKIEKNGKKIQDRKELINTIPCVLFCHDDLDFAVGEPERRRFFIDQSLSMYDILYIDVLRKYKRVLKSRNACLKDQNIEMACVYDSQLVQHGVEIQKKRKVAVIQFNRIFTDLYEKVTGIDGVTVVYEPSWKTENEQELMDMMFARQEKELIMGTTLSGPHRDRILFKRAGQPFIPTASTGQRRLTALILRIAQASYYREITGKSPVLLMDDVLLELDPDKRQHVMTLLPEYEQLFCTFLPGEPYDRYKKSTTRVYSIDKGTWSERS